MGTMKLHPRTFILIGLLRTGVDPGELAKQGTSTPPTAAVEVPFPNKLFSSLAI
jgi:hypothetical protein